jgi:adenylate cyclase class 2
VVVRLRQDTRVRLTYKEGGELVGGAHSRFEAEVEVSDFETMQTILAKLGYTPAWVYEKHRTTYTFDGVEVVLDEMPYGNFVEIEGDSPEAIGRVVERLELGDAQRFDAGYGALFERVRRVLGLTFTDLTFENFRGVNVPQSAFEG